MFRDMKTILKCEAELSNTSFRNIVNVIVIVCLMYVLRNGQYRFGPCVELIVESQSLD